MRLRAGLRHLLFGFGAPGQLILQALYSPPRTVIRKGTRRIVRELGNRGRALRERGRCAYPPPGQPAGGLNRRIAAIDGAAVASLAPWVQRLIPLYREHRFDLLGSGWVRVVHGATYRGYGEHHFAPGPAVPARDWRRAIVGEHRAVNRARALALLEMIDDPAYVPIDWHVDFKSGFRWAPAIWGRNISIEGRPGVDFKVPLELARMYHLPQLALAWGLLHDPALPREFRNQILDFLGSNPPGWGINWSCAMDVAIRAVNILVAWDLFAARGERFDGRFEDELAAAMLAHGRFIVEFLEWHDDPRANHYLSDIVGLAFIAAYLPRTGETDCWLAFATQQLDIEIDRQLLEDGGSFEASTGYHRLSSEMALYAVALILGLPGDKQRALAEYDSGRWHRVPELAPAPMAWPPFRGETLAKLARAAYFAFDVTKPSGEMVQIGDHDSGRLLKLSPRYEMTAEGPREHHLDMAGVIGAAQALYELDLPHAAGSIVPGSVVAALAGGVRLSGAWPRPALARRQASPETTIRAATRVIILPLDPMALIALEPVAYPDFGLFLWRNRRSFIAMRCGPIGQEGVGGHAHNDQLAVEIEIDGVPWARDPGSFIYRPDFLVRNRYRSVLAHFVPRRGHDEPADLVAFFRLEDRAQARCLTFDETGCLGVHQGFGVPVYRRVTLEQDRIVIEDSWPASAIGAAAAVTEYRIRAPSELASAWGLTLPFSPGYGLQEGEGGVAQDETSDEPTVKHRSAVSPLRSSSPIMKGAER